MFWRIIHFIERHDGELRLQEGQIVAQKELPIEGRFYMVDAIGEGLGVVTSLFERRGDDFVRISTTTPLQPILSGLAE